MSNWLITGGAGFIGSSLIKNLVENNSNINIRVLDNLTVGTKEDLREVCDFSEICVSKITTTPNGIELLVGDICDELVCQQAAVGVDVIVHLAANTGVGPSVDSPRQDCLTNVIGTFNVLEAARENGINRFIFASSGAPVGECDPPIHEELAAHPVSPYGASKLAGEGYCSAYNKSFGIETVGLRFGNVYGPRSKHKSSVVAKFIKLAIKGDVCEIYGDGSQTRDFIYIDDLIEAIILASKKVDLGGELFQIATNHETTVGELMGLLVETLESNGVRDVKFINGEARVGDVSRNYSDTSKARTYLGWESKVSLKHGLERVVRSFIKESS